MKPYYRTLLLARRDGFHFSAPPPDLFAAEVLSRGDPEDVICAVLQRVRAGDFGHFSRLRDLLLATRDADLWNTCATLYSYAAPFSVVRGLLDGMQTAAEDGRESIVQQWFIEVLTNMGALWGAPLVRHWLRTNADRRLYQETPWRLSLLLEAERAEIAEGPLRLPSESETGWDEPPLRFDDDAYDALVQRRTEQLDARVPSPARCAVFEGELLHLERVARKLLDRVRRGEDSDEVEKGYMLLMAATGQRLAGFYRDGRLSPLGAAAVIEELLESGELERFTPGVRYFFGRRIPD